MNLVALVGSLLRGGGRRTVLDLSLTIVGLAIPTAITLVVVGTVGAFEGREAAMAWRNPSHGGNPTVALHQRADQFLAGRHIDVVVLDGDHASISPPGMDGFPAPGEMWVSPALERLMAETGLGDVLTERMDVTLAGVLGTGALATANELVAVVGVDDLVVDDTGWYGTVVAGSAAASGVSEIDGFHGATSGTGLPAMYRIAAWIAGTLLVAPSVALLGAGARLTAARRGRRLAALRLAGATNGQVTALAAMETAVGSAIGVLLGLVVGRLGLGFITTITLGGDRFAIGELVPDASLVIGIAVGAMVIALVASLAGLRGVRSTPLGVIRQHSTKAPHIMRLVGGIAAWGIFATIAAMSAAGDREVLGIVIGLGIVIFAVSLMGPLFTWTLGRVVHLAARRATGLLAGRRLIADPFGAFRPATGVILIAFVAGFLLLSTASMPEPTESETLTLSVPLGMFRGDLDPEQVADAARVAFPDETVAVSERHWFGTAVDVGFDSVAELEAGRAELNELSGTFARTPAEDTWDTTLFARDVRKATWIAVSIALIQAAFSTAVGAAASILEQSNTLVALGLAGTDRSMLQRARIAQAALPIGVGSLVAVALGAGAGALTLFGLEPSLRAVVPSVLQALLVVVGALGAAVAGVLLTRPVLTSVLARPLTER